MSDNVYEETRVYTTSTGQRWVPAGPAYAYDGGNVECNPWLDTSYLRTLPGLLKLIVICFNFLCFMCILIGGPAYYAGVGGATFVSVFGFIISLTLLILYLFHIVDQWPQIPWIVCEMIYCFAWTIFYFIAGSVLAVASVSHPHAAGWAIAAAILLVLYTTANWNFGFFGFSAMLAYALDCYLKFLAWKNNERAMGGCGVGGGRGGLNSGTTTANGRYDDY